MIVDFPVSNMEKGCLKQVLKTYFETPPFALFFLLGDHHPIDDNILCRLVIGAGFYLADCPDDVHAFDNLAEYGVFAVKPGGFIKGDEELRAARVGAAVSHREDALAVVL